MQEGGGFFRSLGQGAAAIVSVDSRSLLLAFAMCAGAALYMSLPIEVPAVWQAGLFAGASGTMLLSRRYQRSDILYAFAVIGFGMVLGSSAAAIKARLVEAPVIASETRPVMLEGWVTGLNWAGGMNACTFRSTRYQVMLRSRCPGMSGSHICRDSKCRLAALFAAGQY